MARTTAAAVRVILGKNYDGSTPLDAFIATATVVVDRAETSASEADEALTTTETELMERWLAAHYYTRMDPLYRKKNTGKAGAEFDRDKEGYDYLKVAMGIDRGGYLQAILGADASEGRRVAGGMWLGTEDESEEA